MPEKLTACKDCKHSRLRGGWRTKLFLGQGFREEYATCRASPKQAFSSEDLVFWHGSDKHMKEVDRYFFCSTINEDGDCNLFEAKQ